LPACSLQLLQAGSLRYLASRGISLDLEPEKVQLPVVGPSGRGRSSSRDPAIPASTSTAKPEIIFGIRSSLLGWSQP
ncbi:MAG: hypothetical protein ACREIF_05215, partial [Chthoniobacterales bacterium]